MSSKTSENLKLKLKYAIDTKKSGRLSRKSKENKVDELGYDVDKFYSNSELNTEIEKKYLN